MNSMHPCLTCGACCGSFRVSFHWSETLSDSWQVPDHLTEITSPHLLNMLGTNQKAPRCIALEGDMGSKVHCKIYEQRPSSCRDFKASFEDGTQNINCDKARLSKGLDPLTEKDWQYTLNL